MAFLLPAICISCRSSFWKRSTLWTELAPKKTSTVFPSNMGFPNLFAATATAVAIGHCQITFPPKPPPTRVLMTFTWLLGIPSAVATADRQLALPQHSSFRAGSGSERGCRDRPARRRIATSFRRRDEAPSSSKSGGEQSFQQHRCSVSTPPAPWTLSALASWHPWGLFTAGDAMLYHCFTARARASA